VRLWVYSFPNEPCAYIPCIFSGQGNLALPQYSSYQRTVLVSGQDQDEQQQQHYDDDDPYAPAQYMRQTTHYTLTLYPNDDFFDHYSTSLPLVTTCGAVLIVALTSFMFLIYDFFVRREFDSKRQLLEAKRHFMRFVSHEVRTPMVRTYCGTHNSPFPDRPTDRPTESTVLYASSFPKVVSHYDSLLCCYMDAFLSIYVPTECGQHGFGSSLR
jgi:hypothetical protein